VLKELRENHPDALRLAVRHTKTPLAALLIEWGADVNHVNQVSPRQSVRCRPFRTYSM
jgi:hypothetical protein